MKRSHYLGFLAIAILVVIAGGAAVTSNRPELLGAHRIAGIVLGILMLGLIRFGWAGWAALAIIALEFVPGNPIFHACLAQVLLAIVVFIRTGAPPIIKPSLDRLGWLAMIIPPLVLTQIAFGAAYRHKVWGVMPHMAGAMIVTLLVLVLCMQLIQNRPSLRKPASICMVVILAQVSLGILSFVLRLFDVDSSLWFTAATVAHVTIGAATLAATVSLGRLVVGDPTTHAKNTSPES